VIGPFTCLQEAESVKSYYTTKFFRFLVSLRKITQHATQGVYNYVPMQTWNRTWTDAALYEKYGITPDEQAYIESQIKEMKLDRDDD
jgi:site-specific DNA-methyltransferase (adenine-specific)